MPVVYRPARTEDLQRAGELVVHSLNERPHATRGAIEITAPSIVDPSVFEAAQAHLGKRKRERGRGRCWLLQGLTVCQRCRIRILREDGPPFTQIRSNECPALLSLHRCRWLPIQRQSSVQQSARPQRPAGAGRMDSSTSTLGRPAIGWLTNTVDALPKRAMAPPHRTRSLALSAK
jgi:hypothetical protein